MDGQVRALGWEPGKSGGLGMRFSWNKRTNELETLFYTTDHLPLTTKTRRDSLSQVPNPAHRRGPHTQHFRYLRVGAPCYLSRSAGDEDKDKDKAKSQVAFEWAVICMKEWRGQPTILKKIVMEFYRRKLSPKQRTTVEALRR